jgi:hypothetical protein
VNSIRIAARRLVRLIVVAMLMLCAMPLMAQVNTWSWEPATGYPGKWREAGVVWNPPACCPNSYPNSATADARMNKYSSGYVGAADLDGGSYTVNRLRFTNINSGNFVLTGNGGTLMLRGTTPYIQTGTQGGYLARIVGTHLNLADHTRFDMTVADDGVMVEADSNIVMAPGATAVDKTGPGVLVLAGSSAAGPFDVQGGEFAVEGSHNGSVSVASGATLGGAGHVGGTAGIAAGGALHPGAYDTGTHAFTTGILTIAGGFSMQPGSVFRVRIDGGSSGQLATPGSANLGGATLDVVLGAAPAGGSVFRIVDNQAAGGIAGTFAGLAEGSTLSAGGVGFKISYAGGTGNDATLTVLAAPAITSVSPGTGASAGGQTVTIAGSNFSGASAVTFGGTAAASFTVNSATQISATTPAHAAGAVTVAVTTAGGSGSQANAYTYVDAPTIAAVSPLQGPSAGGTSVTITGTNFSGASAVTFGGTAAASFTVNSATQISATPPAHAAGAVTVAVTTAGGTGSQANAYTYVAAPTVGGVAPTQGSPGGGTSVTITGTNLSGASAVTFGGAAATTFTVNSATQITATTPAHVAGVVTVAVTTAGGSGSQANAYTYVGAPTVGSVAPLQGPTAGGNSVTITGTNFGGTSAVTFGGAAAASFTVNSATQIIATTPAHAAGAVTVAVTADGGSGNKADAYTYVAAPTVGAVAPNQGLTGGGTPVTIDGTHFSGATAVTFGVVAATSFAVVGDGRISAVAPAQAAGTIDVTVTTPGGTSVTGSADRYTYLAPRRCHVRYDAAGANDGASWVDAYADLQSALRDISCTETWVARGVYKPVTPIDAGNVSAAERAATFRIAPGTKLYGGFAGNESTLDARDPAAQPTVLSGDLAGNDTGAANGVDADVPSDGSNADNSLHVASMDGVQLAIGADTVLDGFTVTAGNAGSESGGGLYCGAGAGSGMCSPTLSNLIFSGNAAEGGGAFAAASMAAASPQLSRVVFANNRGGGKDGGAVALADAHVVNPQFTDVTFRGNAARDGGALVLAAASGGSGTPVLDRVAFADNRADGIGGAMRSVGLDLRLSNATFTRNAAAMSGGALGVSGGDAQLRNLTFAANSAANGGAVHHDGGSLSLKNVILWDDSAAQNAELYETAAAGSTTTIADSVIQGGCPAGAACSGGMSSADPKLGALGDHGGFTPTMLPGLGSAAIDAGSDATCAATDQRGLTRPQGAHCDIGSVEVSQHALSVSVTTPNGSVASADGAIAACTNGGGTCAAGYASEGDGTPATVRLSAEPDAHYHFGAWGGDCAADGTVTMDADKTCTAAFAIDLHTVGGAANGLAGRGLEVSLNGGDAQAVTAADPAFTFAPLPDLSAWSVTVTAQPTSPWQTCTPDPASAAGTLDGADVTNVAVNCQTNTYAVGGTVDGFIDTGSNLVLQLSGDDVQQATVASGESTFAFAAPVASGTAYTVSVATQPQQQSCTVDAGASGTILGADVANAHVTCVRTPQLALSVDDGRVYARYGRVADYVVTLTNTGGPGNGIAVGAALSPAFDAAGATWVCYAGSMDARCAASGRGALDDVVTIPPGRRLTFLLSVPVRADTLETTAALQLSVAGAESVTDTNVLVIFRDGIDTAYADGTQGVPSDEREAFVLPPAAGAIVETVKRRLLDGAEIRVDRARLGAQDYVRLRVDSNGAERVSAWSPVRAGAALALGRVDGVVLLEGADASLALSLGAAEQGR